MVKSVLVTPTNQVATQLGRKIRQARLDRGWRQADLAKLMGVSVSSVSAYESGRITAERSHLELIAKYTQRPLHYFTGQRVEEALARVKELQQSLAELEHILQEIIEPRSQ